MVHARELLLSLQRPEVFISDGYDYVTYSVVACVVVQIIIRQVALTLLGANHPKRGVAPRLATKVVNIVFNAVLVVGSIDRLLYPLQSVRDDPIYGFSPHSQFLFSVAGGYFLWATCVSLYYKGSIVAVVQNGVQCGISVLALHPFLHRVGNVFLLTQASNLVLDMYGCGRLLVRRKSYAYLFLRVIHPCVFFTVRIGIALPVSFFFLKDMVYLVQTGQAHDEWTVYFYIVSNIVMNLLNLYWFGAMINASRNPKGNVLSEAKGGEISE